MVCGSAHNYSHERGHRMNALALTRQSAGYSAAWEGGYLYAYPDPGTNGDPWTIGFGHTAAAGPPAVRRGDRITLARAVEIFRADMRRVERDVNVAIKVPLTQPRFAALCSFHLNTGAVRSGTIDDKLNTGDIDGALATWSRYTRAGGRVMQGLVNRRRDEIALFRTGAYPSRRIVLKESPSAAARYIAVEQLPWSGEIKAPLQTVALDRPLPAPPINGAPTSGLLARIWQAIKGIFS